MEFNSKCPKSEATQIIVFGKGYGESILINIGNNKYIVIDSFINPETDNPIVLDYITSIGLDSSAIVGIICSHWDDDHIRGLSSIAESVICHHCISIVVPILPSSADLKKLAFVLENNDNEGDYSTSEYIRLMNLVAKSDLITLKYAKDNTSLFSKELSSCEQDPASIISLSPSDSLVTKFIHSLVVPSNGQIRKNIDLSNNSVSIVLLIRCIMDNTLLGGDLENAYNAWETIVSNYSFYGKCHVFKIPHHGSINAYYDEVWKNMMDCPISIVTRFNKSGLPRAEVVSLIKKNSEKVFILGGKSIIDKSYSQLKGVSSFFSSSVKIVDIKIGMIALSWENGCFRYNLAGAVEEV